MARYLCLFAYLLLLCCALEATSGAPKHAHDVPQRLKKANDVIMKEKGSSAYEKLLILTGKNAQQKSKAVGFNGPEPRAATVENAFSNDIHTCLFQYWSSVVSGKVACDTSKGYKPLCYGPKAGQPKALYVVCYDTDKLIPAYTAHVATPVVGSVSTRPSFKKDTGTYAPTYQAEVNDYATNLQTWPEFDYKKNFYCAKGHLVPNADYGQNDPDKAATTFILTNVAPQWQKFNGGNWLNMEKAVRNYANSKNRNVYVFTGTGGEAEDKNGITYKMNGLVVTPQYFWILVCDPTLKQMVIYVGTNPVGNQSKTKQPGCNSAYQTENLGIVECYSYDQVKLNSDYADFLLPTMNTANCPTNVKGNFLSPTWS